MGEIQRKLKMLLFNGDETSLDGTERSKGRVVVALKSS